MAPVSHQTVKLSRGSHRSAEQGACVMELASMLAGEPFSDHPSAVSPSISGFLRAYNDAVDDERRQDLYTYAAKVVGTGASEEIERARSARLLEWGQQMRRRRWWRAGWMWRLEALYSSEINAAGPSAVRSIHRFDDTSHAQVLALVEELIAMERRQLARPDGDNHSPASATTRPELTACSSAR